jgi:nucleoid-associated protein YgaU
MDQRFRLVTAAAVMLVGLGLALFFRRSAAEADSPVAVPSDPLVLRKQPDPRTFAVSESSPRASQPLPAAPIEPRRVSPTIVTPTDQPGPPPELPKTYPAGGQAASTRWGASMREMLPETASAPPTHRIIDGDSLALLAERYLGSASRAMEIYEANRAVLAHPEILPIGAELKIPRADQAANPAK